MSWLLLEVSLTVRSYFVPILLTYPFSFSKSNSSSISIYLLLVYWDFLHFFVNPGTLGDIMVTRVFLNDYYIIMNKVRRKSQMNDQGEKRD